MNPLKRLLTRVKFKRNITTDESNNVIDSIVKARKLYLKLCKEAHPDKYPHNREIAEEIMQRVTLNQHNYSNLLSLEVEINEKLK